MWYRTKVLISAFVCVAAVSCLPFPDPGWGVPVLKDAAKKSPATGRTAPSKPFDGRHGVTILGSYRKVDGKQPVSLLADLTRRLRPNLISAKSIIVIDAVSGKTLFSRAPDTPRQPASTIKVLTGLIAIDALANQERVPVSPRAARQPSSKIYLDQRKTYRATDLINAVLLASANDASVALAEKIAGSEEKFAGQMTRLARRLGATNTVCKTASGLTARGQKTTARDLAVIFRKAMQDQEFAGRMMAAKVKTQDGKLLSNHNKALWQIDGAVGGKTGYTNAARQTYVGKFRRGSSEIIVAIMGSETMWGDLKRLVSYGFARKQQLTAGTGSRQQPNG